jgi:hypothetical protein
VCVSADVVVVTEISPGDARVSVFSRSDGAMVARFGSGGTGRGRLHVPICVCFVARHSHVAVAEFHNSRVSVFTVRGVFVRHVGVGHLDGPCGVAASAFDELVVADMGHRRLCMFSDVGDLQMTFGDGDFTCVTVHGDAVLAQDGDGERCVVWS